MAAMQADVERADHNAKSFVPHSLQTVCGFFNVPCQPYITLDTGDRAYGLQSLSENARMSNPRGVLWIILGRGVPLGL